MCASRPVSRRAGAPGFTSTRATETDMEDRNPYAAPKVPVVAAPGVDHQFGGEADELEYGGFWRRFGASLLDGLIASPVTVGLLALLYFTRNAYVYSFLP